MSRTGRFGAACEGPSVELRSVDFILRVAGSQWKVVLRW